MLDVFATTVLRAVWLAVFVAAVPVGLAFFAVVFPIALLARAVQGDRVRAF